MGTDHERLQRLLGGPELAGLRRRLRARYERGDPGEQFTLANLSPAERRALEGLTGSRPSMATSMRLSLPELDAALARAGLASSLREALELLDGPIVDRRAQQQVLEQAWEHVGDELQDARLRSYLATPGAMAQLKRATGSDPSSAGQLLKAAHRVLARIPARGIPLAQLAAETCGNAHALDAGEPLASLVLRAAGGTAEEDSGGDEGPREQWARLGVTVNELSAPVLCLNLPIQPGGTVLSPGEPVHLTLRRLLRNPPEWAVTGRDVFICENPSIVTVAADQLGEGCAPLVSTEGMPRTAQRTLLSQMSAAGARLWYHGDFDWPGIIIANLVLRTVGARPWRMGSADYREACRTGGSPLLAGSRVEAVWDPMLAGVMEQEGLAVHEEAVVEGTLQELRGRV